MTVQPFTINIPQADLGDLRRTQWLVQLAHTLAQHPGATLPEAYGSGATAKAAYRFFDHDDMEPPERVQSHLEAKASPATCPMAASHRLP